MPSTSASILLVEDDPKIADMVANYLDAQGFATMVVHDGLMAVETAGRMRPALVLLDLMLPGMDGMEVCRAIRRFSDVPIIMVTARVEEVDRLLGLEIGADDYVCKPFSPRELVARVRAHLRRAQLQLVHAGGPSADAPRLQDHPQRQQITWEGVALPLTPLEYRLLALFLTHPQRVFARASLLDHLHMDFRDVSDRAIDSHIKNVRRKLEQAQASEVGIGSVYGVGYRLEFSA